MKGILTVAELIILTNLGLFLIFLFWTTRRFYRPTTTQVREAIKATMDQTISDVHWREFESVSIGTDHWLESLRERAVSVKRKAERDLHCGGTHAEFRSKLERGLRPLIAEIDFRVAMSHVIDAEISNRGTAVANIVSLAQRRTAGISSPG